MHFFWAIGGERSETQNQALLLQEKPMSVNLEKFKKPSNINAFRPSITTTRLHMRRARLYQLMLMMWRRGWDSNPRGLSSKLISSQPRYDRFDTSADTLLRANILLNRAKSVNAKKPGLSCRALIRLCENQCRRSLRGVCFVRLQICPFCRAVSICG